MSNYNSCQIFDNKKNKNPFITQKGQWIQGEMQDSLCKFSTHPVWIVMKFCP